MIRSFVLEPTITSTSIPCSCIHFTCGYTGAAPTPPATNRYFLFFNSATSSFTKSEAFPRGPTTSRNASPAFNSAIFSVEAPTVWNTIVIVPSSLLKSQIVSGILSPSSSIFTITNSPGSQAQATLGAFTSIR